MEKRRDNKPIHLIDEFLVHQGPEMRDPEDFKKIIEHLSLTKAAIMRLRNLRQEKAARQQAIKTET